MTDGLSQERNVQRQFYRKQVPLDFWFYITILAEAPSHPATLGAWKLNRALTAAEVVKIASMPPFRCVFCETEDGKRVKAHRLIVAFQRIYAYILIFTVLSASLTLSPSTHTQAASQ
uniref:Transposase n=1 Tax=Echinococcus granulosus TaxID=6210 RepID=A0A068WV28_ECHGR|nr:hypothetical protein EgrG_002028300 [Echinococcus granulosus]